jgi:hypothetical protein
MGDPMGVRSEIRAAVAALAFGVAACSGALSSDLLAPPSSSTPATNGDDASAPASSSGGHTMSDDDAATLDATSHGGGGDDDSSEPDKSDDASPDDAATMSQPDVGPASPCPTCTLGTTCCAKTGSTQYGMCYSAALCFGLCCN